MSDLNECLRRQKQGITEAGRGWDCPKCKARNSDDRDVCRRCKAKKPVSEAARDVVSEAGRDMQAAEYSIARKKDEAFTVVAAPHSGVSGGKALVISYTPSKDNSGTMVIRTTIGYATKNAKETKKIIRKASRDAMMNDIIDLLRIVDKQGNVGIHFE